MKSKNPKYKKISQYKKISREDECFMRQALLIAKGGFEFPPDAIDDRRLLPGTVLLALRVAYQTLELKAENLRLRAMLAERYATKIGREYGFID